MHHPSSESAFTTASSARSSAQSMVEDDLRSNASGDNAIPFPSLQPETAKKLGNSKSMAHIVSMGSRGMSRSHSDLSSDEFSKWYQHFFIVLDPDSLFRLTWDALMIVNIVCAGVIIPLLVVYFDPPPSPPGINDVLVYCLDLMWLVDIVLNFRTGLLVKGELKCGQGKIAAHYARGWLLPDLLGAYPLLLTEQGGTGFVVGCILKGPRLLQLLPRFRRLKQGFGGHAQVPLCILTMSFLAVHMMSCMWRTSLRWDNPNPEDAQDHVAEKYVSDVYFVTMTLTSVGYGDVLPTGVWSQLFCIGLMIVGSAVFGALITACSFVLSRLLNNDTDKSISELVRFMKKRAVPKKLQRRVKANLRRHLDYEDSVAMSPQLLSSLSPAMQGELCLSMLRETMLSFPLFLNVQESFAAQLAQAYYFEQVLPGDIVTPEGHAVQEVIFVQQGRMLAYLCEGFKWLDEPQTNVPSEFVEAQTARKRGSMISCSPPPRSSSQVSNKKPTSHRTNEFSDGDDEAVEIHAGAWFGEASLFDEMRVYTAVIAAFSRCELAVLPAEEYRRIVGNYPQLLDRHNSIREAVKAGYLDIRGLRCKNLGRTPHNSAVMNLQGQVARVGHCYWDCLSRIRSVFPRSSKVEQFQAVVVPPSSD